MWINLKHPLKTNLGHVGITVIVFLSHHFGQAGDSNHCLVAQWIVAHTLRTSMDEGIQVKTHALPEYIHVHQRLQHPHSTHMFLCTTQHTHNIKIHEYSTNISFKHETYPTTTKESSVQLFCGRPKYVGKEIHETNEDWKLLPYPFVLVEQKAKTKYKTKQTKKKSIFLFFLRGVGCWGVGRGVGGWRENSFTKGSAMP